MCFDIYVNTTRGKRIFYRCDAKSMEGAEQQVRDYHDTMENMRVCKNFPNDMLNGFVASIEVKKH